MNPVAFDFSTRIRKGVDIWQTHQYRLIIKYFFSSPHFKAHHIKFNDFEVKAFLKLYVKLTTLHYVLQIAGSHDQVSKDRVTRLWFLLMESHMR